MHGQVHWAVSAEADVQVAAMPTGDPLPVRCRVLSKPMLHKLVSAVRPRRDLPPALTAQMCLS